MSLFKKAACFTDIHFGKSGNSEKHNKDCIRYIDWFVENVKAEKCDAIIFLGDWFDNRVMIRNDTNDYSTQAINKLVECNLPIYWIVGNHDMFYRDNRSVNWITVLESYEQINVINEPVTISGVGFVPWLVGAEFTIPPNMEAKYIFGHFEFPTFLVNEMIEMQDYGKGILADHFDQSGLDGVFAGHFHKRQIKLNSSDIPITYIGNAFPHNFNDANDTERGMMVLEWDKSPKFIDWDEAPTYIRVTTTELIEAMVETDDLSEIFDKYSTVECVNDGGGEDDKPMNIEEAVELKDMLAPYVRNVSFDQYYSDVDVTDETEITEILTTEQMVVNHLNNLDLKGSRLEVEIFLELWEDSEN